MNRETLIGTLTDAGADALALSNAVDDGLIARMRDGMVGHPRSPSFDAGRSTSNRPEDLPDELRGKAVHSDPTGTSAVQVLMAGDRARDDVIAFQRHIVRARRDLQRALVIAARYNPRPANAVEQQTDAAEDRGCESCARVDSPGSVGKRAGRSRWWNPTHATKMVAGRSWALCHWCDNGEVGVKRTGEIPPVADVESYRDHGRARKRSA